MTTRPTDGVVLCTPERIVRTPLEDESVLYDRICPRCGKNIIARWDWARREYKRFRCQGLKCSYGNAGIPVNTQPKLPPLDFEI